MKERMWTYYTHNFNFSIYYDKLYRKEYLPSRISYNQFFFYSALFASCSFLLFAPQWSTTTDEKNLGARRYYTSDRTLVNMLSRGMNKSAAASHVSKQEYTF